MLAESLTLPLSAACGRVFEPGPDRLASGQLRQVRRARVDARQRLVAAEQRELSKMPGETVVPAIATRSGWKTSRGLAPRRSTHAAQRLLDRARTSNGSRARQRRAGVGQRVAARRRRATLARLRVVGRAVEDEARQRPEVGERLDLLLADARPPSRRPVAAGEAPPGAASSSSVPQLAHVAPVQPAQLLLVEARRVALTRARARSARRAPRWRSAPSRRRRRPSRAARGSCAPPRAGSRRRAAPAPTPRRGAWRASCRRGRAAAAGARRRGGSARRAPRARAAAWACWRGGPRRGRRG